MSSLYIVCRGSLDTAPSEHELIEVENDRHESVHVGAWRPHPSGGRAFTLAFPDSTVDVVFSDYSPESTRFFCTFTDGRYREGAEGN